MFGLVVIEVMTLSGHLSNINEMRLRPMCPHFYHIIIHSQPWCWGYLCLHNNFSIPENSVFLSSSTVATCFGLLLALGFQGFNLVNEARHANKGDHMNNMNVQFKAFKMVSRYKVRHAKCYKNSNKSYNDALLGQTWPFWPFNLQPEKRF